MSPISLRLSPVVLLFLAGAPAAATGCSSSSGSAAADGSDAGAAKPGGSTSGTGAGSDGGNGGSAGGVGASTGDAGGGNGGPSASDGGGAARDAGSDGGHAGDAGGETGAMPTHLPIVTGTCPAMASLNDKVISFAGQDVTVWSGDPAKGPGPLLLYWYATGSNPQEVLTGVGQAQIAKIVAAGGMIAAQNLTTATGGTTGNDVWYKGDAAIADEVVACAVKNQNIDARRISSLGYSAGALQTTYMWFARSGYIASVITYSGGEDGADQVTMQDPAHPPAAVVAHGAKGSDVYGTFDFFVASTAWETDIVAAKGFAIDCDDGGAHGDFGLRTSIAPEAIQFLLDHPYGVSPEPYTTLPSAWPGYCSIK